MFNEAKVTTVRILSWSRVGMVALGQSGRWLNQVSLAVKANVATRRQSVFVRWVISCTLVLRDFGSVATESSCVTWWCFRQLDGNAGVH